MNEITLNALINLFALFSSVTESKREEAVETFSLYLQNHLGISSAGYYLQLFEDLLDLYGTNGLSGIEIDKTAHIKKISENIKGVMQRSEQIMVFIRFLELAKKGNTNKAKEVFETMANVFEIDAEEYLKFKSFTLYTPGKKLVSAEDDFLLINNMPEANTTGLKHIMEKNLNGEILFLRSKLLDNALFIFYGNDELTLGGNIILPGRFYAFREGGIIRGPRISPIYYIDIVSEFSDDKAKVPFSFSAEEIRFRFKNSENGLHTFTFNEHSGELIAIMGGSGVGKSTLINILNGNIPVQNGSIKMNGHDITARMGESEGLIGYVPQDDLLFEELTVWENLYYNACLCFDNLQDNDIRLKVDNLLNELQLYPIKDLKVGTPLKKFISGGQRKRLNVAMELIREPAILFVDEPTSGLSSTDSEIVMLLLKEQARKGRLILVNIHQPSSAIYKLFDKLWVMDKGGRPIYNGNPLDAIIYFKKAVNHVTSDISECPECGNVNPEQVLDIIETKNIDSSGRFTNERRFTPDYWYDLYRLNSTAEREEIIENSKKSTEKPLPESITKRPGIWKQFKIFFRRNLRTKIVDSQYMLVNLLEAPLLALIVAFFTKFSEGTEYIFFENKSLIPYIFMSIVVVIFMGMSISAEEIIKDRKILQREAFLNLSRFSYINSKVLFLFLLSAFQSICFVLIGNLIIGLENMIFTYWIVLFSVAFFSNMLGLNISSALDSVVTIYILIPLLLIPQILLCGVIVKFDDLQNKRADRDAVPIVGDLMVSRWAFEAIVVEQYQNNPYESYFFEMEREMINSRYRSDIMIPELTSKIDFINGSLNRGEYDEKKLTRDMNIVRNGIIKLDKENPENKPFSLGEKLYLDLFNSEIAGQAKEHLDLYKKEYKSISQQKSREKDNLINGFNAEYGSDYLSDLKMRYHNASLENLVLNKDSRIFYRTTANTIMQKTAPIFKEPDFRNGRAHFLASYKKIGNIEIPTLIFNLIVIWLMSILLYFALYYDWLRKLM